MELFFSVFVYYFSFFTQNKIVTNKQDLLFSIIIYERSEEMEALLCLVEIE